MNELRCDRLEYECCDHETEMIFKCLKWSISGRFTSSPQNQARSTTSSTHFNLISLSQQSYAQKIVVSYLLEDSLTSTYPLNMDNIKDGKALDPENNPIYKIMGQLRYLADRTRSDLLYLIIYLSIFILCRICNST